MNAKATSYTAPDLAADESEESGDELFEHFHVTADRGQGMLRLDKFLTTRLENTSRNRIQAAADAGNILVNGKPAKSSYKVKPLDQISIVLPYPPRELEIIAENIPLNIVYEDADLIVVNKEAGMVVHPGHGNYTGTLVNALTYHLQGLPLFEAGDMRAGLVHRIDKNTSGLLVVAKTSGRTPFSPGNSTTTPSDASTMRWCGAISTKTKGPSPAISPATRPTGCEWPSIRRTARWGNMP